MAMETLTQSWVPLFMLVLVNVIATTLAQNYQMTFSILEERFVGRFVGNVSSNVDFISGIPLEEYGYIRFGFLRQSYIQTVLDLNERTGVITTAIVVDRESRNICQSQNQCSLTFKVAVHSTRPQSSFFAVIDVTLIIEDINDNAPLFPSDLLHLEIPESATAGTSFHIESAIDLDAGINSVQSYKIMKQDGDFSLDVVKKLDGSFTVKLLLNSALDRETKDHFSVMIMAADGGTPQKFGALSVNITVLDANDNPPVFMEKSYNITVRENVTLDTTLLQLSATDRDIGENGRITYSFSQNQLDAHVKDIFKITPNSGELKLKNKLVYESGLTYTIIAEAEDNGIQPHVTQVIVTVQVMDVGNNPPIIEVNLLSQENSRIVNLSESARVGTFVAHVEVIDKDTGDNGRVQCHISNPNFELQSMIDKMFKVVVSGSLDREAQDLHQININCSDYGSPALTATASFLVSLNDENDCPPIFITPIFTGSVPENHKEFRTFVEIIAYDKDLGQNSEVRYSIDTESTDFRFWIDEVTGSLRADQMFDREITPVITFKVIARDLGKPSMSNKATVQLTITDQNDNTPELQGPLQFSVEENKHSDTVVGVLRATDKDIGDNAKTMFLIHPDVDFFSVPFVVFPDGKIKTTRQLDREVRGQYQFQVFVVDHGVPRLTGSADITITVNDTNDNPPRLHFPKGKDSTAIVYSDTNPGHQVTQIEADDADAGVNKHLAYEIMSGNSDELFLIDSKLGGIYLNRKIVVTQNRTYHLAIVVRDGGQPQHSTESVLNIVLVPAVNGSSSVHGGDNSSNTTIVVIVVVLTAVLSVVMIIIICFLRRFDHRSKARRNLDIVAPDEKYPKCYMEDTTRYLDNGTGSHDHLTLTYDPMSPVSCPKKKEVSFDIDEQLDHGDLRDQHNTTMSTFSAPESEKLQGMSGTQEGEECAPEDPNGRLNKLQLLQYHQAVLESQTRAWLQSQDNHEESSSFEQTLPDDKYSDTSEEVTASDSGKGGSEDDMPSNHSKDIKHRVLGPTSSKFQTHHYVAPEFRRQGSLQRKACNINLDDLQVHSPLSPGDEMCYRPDSRASMASHSTPRATSRQAMCYPHEHPANRTIDSAYEPSGEWDAASYV